MLGLPLKVLHHTKCPSHLRAICVIEFSSLSSGRQGTMEPISIEKLFSIPNQDAISEHLNDEEENKTSNVYQGLNRSPEAEYGHFKVGMVIFPEFIREQLRRAHKNNPYKYLFTKDIARMNAIAQASNKMLSPSPEPRDHRILTPSSGRLEDGLL